MKDVAGTQMSKEEMRAKFAAAPLAALRAVPHLLERLELGGKYSLTGGRALL
jgi:hypothetical protein